MMKTMAFERFLRPLWALCIAGCASSPGTSGETHFQCSATPDCKKHGPDLVCVEEKCVPEAVDNGRASGGAGSTSTGEPPRAAADISVGPGNGTCTAPHGVWTMPQDQRVYDYLRCNLASGCSPNEIVAVDGDAETQVTCNVSPTGDTYSINAHFAYQGSDITASGSIGSNGGDVQMTHYYRQSGVGLSGTCNLTIEPDQGAVALGRVWAYFTCPDFSDPSAAGGTDCSAEGAFLFERCDGG